MIRIEMISSKKTIYNLLFSLIILITGCDENFTYHDEENNITVAGGSMETPPALEITPSSTVVDKNITTPSVTYYDTNMSNQKKFQVIDNKDDLDKIYQSLDVNNTLEIDFNKNNLVSLTLGKKLSNENTIKVTETKIINYDDDNSYLKVSVETTIKDENCIESREEVIPLNFATIPKYRDILFDESIKYLNCNDENVSEEFDPIDFREVVSTEGGYEENKIIEVIQDSQKYEVIYNKFTSRVDKTLPYVDFENEILLFISNGFYTSYDHNIKVLSVDENNQYIVVNIKNIYFGGECSVEEAEITPSTFVAIPKTDKEIIFKEFYHVEYCEDE